MDIKLEMVVTTTNDVAMDIALDNMIDFGKKMEAIFRDSGIADGYYKIGVRE